MSKKRLVARHMRTARVAMFAVTSLRRPITCPFATQKKMNERTHRLEKIKYIRQHGSAVYVGIAVVVCML